jgi:hypothetical protein
MLSGIGFDCLVPVSSGTFGDQRASPVIIRGPDIPAPSVACQRVCVVGHRACSLGGGGRGGRQLFSQHRDLLSSRGLEIGLLGLRCRDLSQTCGELSGPHRIAPEFKQVRRRDRFVKHETKVTLAMPTRASLAVPARYSDAKAGLPSRERG